MRKCGSVGMRVGQDSLRVQELEMSSHILIRNNYVHLMMRPGVQVVGLGVWGGVWNA